MNAPTSCHPDTINAFLEESLSPEAEADWIAHLDTCHQCRSRLRDATGDSDVWDEFQTALRLDDLSPHRVETARRACQAQVDQVLGMLAPTDDPSMLGRIGAYEVRGVVGSGGMGVVLKALDPSLDRIVAIKVMLPHLATSAGARARFAREAKATAAILHPNVIAIHSVSSDESLPFLVMPYLRGQSLQNRIDSQGPLPLGEILRIGAQVAAGLAAAHEQGLVHRDIKPANILLEDGVERVAITDFGLARTVDDASMTMSGVIAGTPQYMSPEQVRGETMDGRSDLFSLGSVLYAMCTSQSPFCSETSFGSLHQVIHERPRPIRELNSEIPVWLTYLIDRLHEKAAGKRVQSARHAEQLLTQCIAHVEQPDYQPLPEELIRPRPIRFGALFLVLLLLLLLGGGIYWSKTKPNSQTPNSIHPHQTIPAQPEELVLQWDDTSTSELRETAIMLDIDSQTPFAPITGNDHD